MNEERRLAEEHKYESPVWNTIDETHLCYNTNMTHLINNAEANDMIFVASHNSDSVDLAKKTLLENEERYVLVLEYDRDIIKDKRVRFG